MPGKRCQDPLLWLHPLYLESLSLVLPHLLLLGKYQLLSLTLCVNSRHKSCRILGVESRIRGFREWFFFERIQPLSPGQNHKLPAEMQVGSWNPNIMLGNSDKIAALSPLKPLSNLAKDQEGKLGMGGISRGLISSFV
ncbi:hypothetical protein SLA2020_117340 [Shorea laevis]